MPVCWRLGRVTFVSMSAKEINVSDPRVQAAMKVLGITADNLRPKEQTIIENADIDPDAVQNMARVRHEKNEALRQRWLKEVKDAAEAISDADVDALLGPSTSVPSQFSAMHFDSLSHDRMEKQKAKLEEQRNRNRNQIQRAIEEKMSAEQKAELERKREEDQRKRLLELKKEQKVKVQSQIEFRKARTAKNHENLMQLAQSAREKMRSLDNKLKTLGKAAWEKTQSARVGDEQKRRERREKMDRIWEARDHEHESLHNSRMEAYKAQIEKEQEMEQRLEEKKDERIQKAYAARAKFAEKIGKLHEEQEEEEMKRYNKQFKDHYDKLDSGKARAEELMKAKVSALTDARTNRHAKAITNKEAHKEQEKQQIKDTRRRLRDAVDFAGLARTKKQQETKYTVSESQDITNELVLTNKERIKLSEEHRREQAINRLHANTARTQVFADERTLLTQQRKNIQKEHMMDKNTLRIALGGIRDSSPKKVNELLKNLDLPQMNFGQESKEETEALGQTQQ